MNREEILNKLDKLFGQTEPYYWSTYILPNGHFLNPDNAPKDYNNGENFDYEHSDFIYAEDNLYGESLFDNCVKINATCPYIICPNNITKAQINALDEFCKLPGNLSYDWISSAIEDWLGDDFNKYSSYKYPIYVETKYGKGCFDLNYMTFNDILKSLRTGSFNESLNESINQDILDKVIEYCGTTDYTVNGPSYILPNGEFLKIWDSENEIAGLSGNKPASGHTKQHLDIDGLIYKFTGKIEHNYYLNENCIRVNNGFEKYIVLSKEEPNAAQYEALTLWIDNFFYSNKELHVLDYQGTWLNSKYYNREDYTTDDIIIKIKRYYRTGELKESINISLTEEDFDTLDDLTGAYDTVEKFRNIARYLTDSELKKVKDYCIYFRENIDNIVGDERTAKVNELSLKVEPYLEELIEKHEQDQVDSNIIDKNNLKAFFNKYIKNLSDEELIKKANIKTNNSFSQLGASFVLKDGTVINVSDSDKEAHIHVDIIETIFDSVFKDALGEEIDLNYYTDDLQKYMNYFTYERGWLRVNFGNTDYEPSYYCVLPNKGNITEAHYNKLLDFFNWGMLKGHRVGVLIYASDYHDSKSYLFKDYIPEEIVKKVKRYYTTDIFTEDIDYREVYKGMIKSSKPKRGPIFITEDGLYINVGENKEHSAIFGEEEYDGDDYYTLEDIYKLIKANGGNKYEPYAYIDLWTEPNEKQKEAIINWMYFLIDKGIDSIEVNTANNNIRYNFKEYFPEAILDKSIKYC